MVIPVIEFFIGYEGTTSSYVIRRTTRSIRSNTRSSTRIPVIKFFIECQSTTSSCVTRNNTRSRTRSTTRKSTSNTRSSTRSATRGATVIGSNTRSSISSCLSFGWYNVWYILSQWYIQNQSSSSQVIVMTDIFCGGFILFISY